MIEQEEQKEILKPSYVGKSYSGKYVEVAVKGDKTLVRLYDENRRLITVFGDFDMFHKHIKKLKRMALKISKL